MGCLFLVIGVCLWVVSFACGMAGQAGDTGYEYQRAQDEFCTIVSCTALLFTLVGGLIEANKHKQGSEGEG